MRALVTGAAGFIGRYVTEAMRAAGHDVVRCDPQSDGRYWNVRDLHPMDSFDAAIHCAAAVVTTAAKAAAGVGIAENLAIDAAFFQWAAAAKPGRVVYFSSSCVYPLRRSGRPMPESAVSLRQPQWPDGLYGWCKLTGEQLAAQLAADGVPVTVVRPFSVYGPGMRPGFAVSGFCEQARMRADPLLIWGDAFQTRDFIHVTDVARAVRTIVTDGIGGPVNLGTGRGTSLLELAHIVTAASGYLPQVKVDESQPAGVLHLVADTGRLREFCEPQVSLEEGINGMPHA